MSEDVTRLRRVSGLTLLGRNPRAVKTDEDEDDFLLFETCVRATSYGTPTNDLSPPYHRYCLACVQRPIPASDKVSTYRSEWRHRGALTNSRQSPPSPSTHHRKNCKRRECKRGMPAVVEAGRGLWLQLTHGSVCLPGAPLSAIPERGQGQAMQPGL